MGGGIRAVGLGWGNRGRRALNDDPRQDPAKTSKSQLYVREPRVLLCQTHMLDQEAVGGFKGAIHGCDVKGSGAIRTVAARGIQEDR